MSDFVSETKLEDVKNSFKIICIFSVSFADTLDTILPYEEMLRASHYIYFMDSMEVAKTQNSK